jgi:hypothetical protein
VNGWSGATIEVLEPRRLMAAAPTILFIRGATRSGGFLDGGNANRRNEQLADINNTSTTPGNHGWATLAQTLRDEGFAVEQKIEPKGKDAGGVTTGSAIRFEKMDLSKYSAIVFGSNNAKYPKASVSAVMRYVAGGGGALFLSDANFGSNWRDAADSDQQFLSRLGLRMQQDNGVVTAAGAFVDTAHPVMKGVKAFEGEGVSPIVVPAAAPKGVTWSVLARSTGQTRNNDGADPANQFAGSVRPVNDRDAALVAGTVGRGKFAAFFDRNTFFNANGAGTDINWLDNKRLAQNLFGWVADSSAPVLSDASFVRGSPSEVRLTFDDHLGGSLARGDVLLRDAFSGKPVPRERWSLGVLESAMRTDAVIRIRGAQPAGTYQVQINARRIRDDAGNANISRIRFTSRWLEGEHAVARASCPC